MDRHHGENSPWCPQTGTMDNLLHGDDQNPQLNSNNQSEGSISKPQFSKPQVSKPQFFQNLSFQNVLNN